MFKERVQKQPNDTAFTFMAYEVDAAGFAENFDANLAQINADYFEDTAGVPPADTTLASWLPFHHGTGLVPGISGPIASGFKAVLTSPIAFLQKPTRWISRRRGGRAAVARLARGFGRE
jgi:acyl-CoA synthetase (AMP-forming)/AMP-acid ligase II